MIYPDVAPLIIFHFPVVTKGPLFNALSGIPIVGDVIADNLGVPIPIYLDESFTGLVVKSQSKAIDIDTVVQGKDDDGTPHLAQNTLNNLVTVNMTAKNNSIVLGAITALCDLVFAKVVSGAYSISYFYQETLVLNGKLHGFSSETDDNDDLLRLTLQLSKGNLKGTRLDQPFPFLTKQTGTIPLVGAS